MSRSRIARIACIGLIGPILAAGSASSQESGSAPTPRRPLGFKVFNNMDQPVTGVWELQIPEAAARRLEIRESVAGNADLLVAVDTTTGEEILRLTRKKEGIGYDGQIYRLLSACGFDVLAITEFVPLGDAAVLRFETSPPSAACPPLDSGRSGRFYAFSRKGGPLRLRAYSEISGSTVRETYSVGGDRPNTEVTRTWQVGSVSVDDGSELKFLRRVKAPLDGAFWFEVEAVVSPEAGVEPPRGFLKADSLRFVGSLTLKRAR